MELNLKDKKETNKEIEILLQFTLVVLKKARWTYANKTFLGMFRSRAIPISII